MKYSNKNIRLLDLAEIFTGLSYQKKEISLKSNGINFIQAKDIVNNQLFKNTIFKIEKISIDKRFILIDNDILFSAKGNRNFAFLYKNAYGESTASSTFFIIRITNNSVLPEYLSWYLNQKSAQDYFKSQSTGTFIPSINKMQLGELTIPIPAIEIQSKIIKVDTLRKKEKELLNMISSKRDLLIENILYKIIKES